jgi:hypothetical protein
MKSYNDYLDEQEQSWIVKGNNEMEMKTVKIMIEFEMPESTTHVAVDKNGIVSYNIGNESYRKYPQAMEVHWSTHHLARVANWRETLTEVKLGE